MARVETQKGTARTFSVALTEEQSEMLEAESAARGISAGELLQVVVNDWICLYQDICET